MINWIKTCLSSLTTIFFRWKDFLSIQSQIICLNTRVNQTISKLIACSVKMMSFLKKFIFLVLQTESKKLFSSSSIPVIRIIKGKKSNTSKKGMNEKKYYAKSITFSSQRFFRCFVSFTHVRRFFCLHTWYIFIFAHYGRDIFNTSPLLLSCRSKDDAPRSVTRKLAVM